MNIQLTRGRTAAVDEIDRDLARHSWSTTSNGYGIRNLGGGRQELLHRAVMVRVVGRPLSRDEEIDHIDGDKLNCRRENLRFATPRENQQNRHRNWGSSRFKGVGWHKQRRRWRARIFHNGKTLSLGLFVDEIDAARAYDVAARAYFGEFASTNGV